MANTTADKLNRLEETKQTLTEKLIEKGLDVPDNTTFLERANLVSSITSKQETVTLSVDFSYGKNVTMVYSLDGVRKEVRVWASSGSLKQYEIPNNSIIVISSPSEFFIFGESGLDELFHGSDYGYGYAFFVSGNCSFIMS